MKPTQEMIDRALKTIAPTQAPAPEQPAKRGITDADLEAFRAKCRDHYWRVPLPDSVLRAALESVLGAAPAEPKRETVEAVLTEMRAVGRDNAALPIEWETAQRWAERIEAARRAEQNGGR